ncbi:zinc-binding dehydrogenase [Amycolatopsis sp. lyj-109]|uniref:zinc-binding dehydrogenase n=1 Tax=Amycolatopsis sp. lyj-109 TaxID=2789287 RepID=UPI00397DD6C0
MKAAQFNQYGGPEVLQLVDLPDPHPGPGQVRIKVSAAGISASDTKIRRGELSFGATLPQTTGADVAGIVDEIGDGMTDRVRALAPDGVDVALDVAGNGVLPELIALAGGEAKNVITVADFAGAEAHGVHFSNGFADGNAFHALATIGELVEAGKFWLPVERTFPLADIAEAHHASETGHVRGRLVLIIS